MAWGGLSIADKSTQTLSPDDQICEGEREKEGERERERKKEREKDERFAVSWGLSR